MSKQISTKTTIRNLTAEIKNFRQEGRLYPCADRSQRCYQVSWR